jgi:hypothetical protein
MDDAIPMQPLADEAASLAKEFASLLEAEQDLAKQERERTFLAQRLAQATRDQLATTRQLAGAYDGTANAAEAYGARVKAIGGIFQQAFSGNLGGALGGLFGMMAERGKGKDGKETTTLGNAVGSVGGAVVSTFQAIAGAGRTLFDSLMGLAKAGSPAFSAAFGEVMEYLMTQIAASFVPLLMPLVAAVLMYSDVIADAARKLALVILDVAQSIYNVVRNLKNFSPTDAAVDVLGGPVLSGIAGWIAGSPAGGPREADDGDKAFEAIREILKEQGENAEKGEKIDMREAFKLITDSMKVNQGNKPAFEGVESAWKRIMQSEAGTSDLRKKSLEAQMKLIQIVEKIMNNMTRKGPDADGTGETRDLADFGAG